LGIAVQFIQFIIRVLPIDGGDQSSWTSCKPDLLIAPFPHEGPRPHPEEPALAGVSNDEAADLETR